jgi:hypothetical protein
MSAPEVARVLRSASRAVATQGCSKITRGSSRNRQRFARLTAVDFDRINRAALAVLPALLRRWLPDGRIDGSEYIALNPRRPDRHLGSFSINLRTGRWADFAIDGARGGDPTSLAAYLASIGQADAASRLASMLGIEIHDAR